MWFLRGDCAAHFEYLIYCKNSPVNLEIVEIQFAVPRCYSGEPVSDSKSLLEVQIRAQSELSWFHDDFCSQYMLSSWRRMQ